MNFDQLKVSPMTLEEQVILKNLYPLYLHDLSEYYDQDMDDNGAYDIEFLDLFFQKEDLVPLLIKLDESIVGFILIQKGKYAPSTGEDYYLSEFFILKKYRKRGIGREVIRKLFLQYPGKYALCQLHNNLPAITFWKNVYHTLGINYEESLEDYQDTKLLFQRFQV